MKRKYLFGIIVSSILAFAFLFFIWGAYWNTDQYLMGIINATFAVGVLYFGAGWLIIASNTGIFDIAVYGTKKYFLAFINKHQNMAKSYFEYSQSRSKIDRFIYLYMGAVGFVYILVALVINIFFYY